MKDSVEQKVEGHRFIIDEPAPIDFFKSHSALVKAIIGAIKQNPKVHSIGLLGSWGSGKSTIVADLQKSLEGDEGPKTYSFFGYDAWVHQGDPLRRSFLEELIATLSAEGICTRSHWEKELRKLTGRVETARSTNIPTFTLPAKLLFLSILPLPIALSFIDFDLIEKVFGTEQSKLATTTLLWSVILALLPLIVMTCVYLCTRPWRKFSNFKESFWTATPDILSLIVTKTAQSSNTRTLKSVDPTSLEFQTAFRKILSAISPLRLIVVIDNIDRLSEKESFEVWSVMRGLLTKKSLFASDDIQVHDPIVILPIDPTAMKLLLSNNEPSAERIAAELISKSFDLVYYVPKPVQSDWKDYFDKQVRSVFGDTVEVRDLFWITKYFEHYLITYHENVITPRLVNHFINSIASFASQQLEKFDIRTVAFYLSRKVEIESDILLFLHETKEVEGLEADWEGSLVSMHYGVTRETAAHVLLAGPLAEAILACDFVRFAAYSERRGFQRVVASFLDDAPVLEDDHYSLSPLLKLALLCEGEGNASAISHAIWDRLIERVLKSGWSPIPSHDFVTGVNALIRHLSKPVRNTFAETIGSAIMRQFQQEPDEQMYIELAESALALAEIYDGSQGPIFHTGDSVLKAMQFLTTNKDSGAVLDLTKVKHSWDDIAKYVEEAIVDATKSLFVPEFVSQVRDLDIADRFFSGTREAAYKQIIENTNGLIRQDEPGTSELSSALQVTGILSALPVASPIVQSFFSENILEPIFDAATAANDDETLAQIAALATMRSDDVEETLAAKIVT